MISLIDCTSKVRHAYFDAITALGQSVNVFHSPESFVNLGALFKTDLLIIGTTRFFRTESEPLRWASAVCPKLKTILLIGDGIELCLLSDVCNVVSSSNHTHYSASRLELLKTSLTAHSMSSIGLQFFRNPKVTPSESPVFAYDIGVKEGITDSLTV